MFKTRISNIIKGIENLPSDAPKDKFYDFVEKALDAPAEYVKAVVSMEYTLKIAKSRYQNDVEAFQTCVANCDKNRRIQHLNLVDQINILNRLCTQRLGIEPFYTCTINEVEYGKDVEFNGEHECRRAAAEMAKNFVDEFWFDGRYRTQGKDLLFEVSQDDNVVILGKNILDECR